MLGGEIYQGHLLGLYEDRPPACSLVRPRARRFSFDMESMNRFGLGQDSKVFKTKEEDKREKEAEQERIVQHIKRTGLKPGQVLLQG